MKPGDAVLVRNIGADPDNQKSWARGTMVRPGPDDETVVVKIDDPGHALDGKELTVDAGHLNEGVKMKIFNTKAEAQGELKHGQAIDKTAFVQRVWLGNRHVYGIRVGIDSWYAGKGLPAVKAKHAEDPEK